MSLAPRLSVVMAVYNDGTTARAAIDSVLAQSFDDFELVVVDDGSDDGGVSSSVVEECARRDRRVLTVRNATNVGLAASLNRGIERASGTLIARMDADDVCVPDRLAKQVRFLEGHAEVDVVGGWATLVDRDGGVVGTMRRAETHDELARDIYRRNPFVHPTVVMRRGFFERSGGYDSRLRRAQDLDLWLRSYRTSRFHNLQEPLLSYRVHPTLSTAAVVFGSYVLATNARRESRTLTGGAYALRYLAAGVLSRMGVVDWRTWGAHN